MNKYKDMTITSPFGHRLNPITNEKEFHVGLDVRADSLRSVYSLFSCVYYRDGYGNKAGKFLQLRSKINETRFYFNFFHLQSIESWIKSPAKIIRPGDRIAEMGNSGLSTAIHLHFECFSYMQQNDFIEKLKDNINYHISDERRSRIYFEPIELYDYCIKNNIYI